MTIQSYVDCHEDGRGATIFELQPERSTIKERYGQPNRAATLCTRMNVSRGVQIVASALSAARSWTMTPPTEATPSNIAVHS